MLLRVDDMQAEELAKRPGVHIAVMGGRVMKNWLEAGGEAIGTCAELLDDLAIGRDYAQNLPSKWQAPDVA